MGSVPAPTAAFFPDKATSRLICEASKNTILFTRSTGGRYQVEHRQYLNESKIVISLSDVKV